MADDEKKINMKNDLDDKKVKGEIDEQNDKETKIQETPKQIRQTVMKGGSVINIKEIETFTVAKLQEELEKLKLPTDGKKLILIERLKTAAIFLGKTNDPEKKDIMNKDEDDIKTKNESNTEKENDMDSDEYYAHFFSDNIGDKRKKVSKTEKKVLDKKSSRPTSSESESEEELGYDSRNSKKLSLNMKKGKLNFDTSDYSESDDSSDQEMLKQPTKTKRRDHRWRDMRETRYEHDRRECNEREHDRRERNEHERDRRERDRRERSRREGNRAKHEFTIRDVENSLTEFSGDDKIQVEQWLNEFEDISNLLEWHDLQKIIYAKRMLKGSAKKFMLTKKISTWKKFKKDLTKEFTTKLSSATVHSQLRKRKRLSDETAKQYIYSMIEIANQGTVDEEALVEYIIDGIQDYESNKAILYSARNIQELKKCFEAYERMKEKSKGRQTTTQKEESKHRNKENKNQTSSTKEDHGNKNSDGKRPGQKRCFSCGSKEHERVNCTNKDKGPKCFKCNMFGHIAPNCTKESQSVGCISSNDEGLISMKVRGRNYRALLDTGSDVNLVPTDIYEKIGRPEMSPTTRCFTGLGNKTTNPVGRVKLDIEIDNQVYSTPFYVVPKDSMKYNFILGQEWIKDMEITISQGKISVRQVPARCEQGQDNDGLLLNATCTEFHEDLKVLQCIAVDEIDVPAPYEAKVRQLLEDYSPQKQVKTNIETKIKLKDDDPVCLQPRRLAPKEKKILSDQIKEWLEKDIIRPSDTFQKTLGKINLPPKVTRWALQLEEFDYEIEHRMGDRMKHVDALSRNPVMMVEDLMLEVIKKEQKKEERLNVIIQLLLKEPYEDYSMQNEILMKTIDGRNVVVLPTSMQQEVLKKVHDNGHFGTKKMQEIIQADYYVPRLREKLDHLVECCITCIMAEKKKGKKEGLLRPIPKGDIPLHTYHVDHIGPITATSKLYKYLFVVVDSFSKFTWIFPTKTTNASEVLSKMDIMQASFGNPYRIISDRGAAFTSTTFQEYCAKEKIEHVLTTTGVPRGNGQVERINGIIVPVLTKFSKDKPEQWYRHVNKLQRCINSTFQRSIGRSPFEVLFGVKMRHQDDVAILEVLEQEAVELFDREREDLRNAAKKSILKIQEENKKYHDKHSKEARNYQEGDIVAIRRTQFGPGMKIKQKYLGPYKVSQVKGNDRYEVIRVGNFDEDGSMITTTSADYMKPYVFPSEAEGFRGWPNVGFET